MLGGSLTNKGAVRLGLCAGALTRVSADHMADSSSFEAVAPFNIVKDFAVGRTVFYEAARDAAPKRSDNTASSQASTL
jgi:5-dehydro-2-deoxygluconokinase